jgi:hypothetical protein
VLGYFRLTMLSTIGFGDITPLTLRSRRYAAVAEGISGQFYLVILVARLVGLQTWESNRESTHRKMNFLCTDQKTGISTMSPSAMGYR